MFPPVFLRPFTTRILSPAGESSTPVNRNRRKRDAGQAINPGCRAPDSPALASVKRAGSEVRAAAQREIATGGFPGKNPETRGKCRGAEQRGVEITI